MPRSVIPGLCGAAITIQAAPRRWRFRAAQARASSPGGSLPNGDYAMKALWGDDRPYFLIDGERHLWTVAPTNPYLGRRAQGFIRPINVIRWSKPGVQDKLNFFMHGYGETDWRILPAADQDYRKQVTAWDRREFGKPELE